MPTENSTIIQEEARNLNLEVKDIVPERNYFEISSTKKTIAFAGTFIIRKSLFSPPNTTMHKDITQEILRRENLPTPETLILWRETMEPLSHKIDSFPYPAILKLSSSSKSRGLVPLIQNSIEAKNLIQEGLNDSPCLLLQRMVFGKEYRVLVLNEKLLGSLEMLPPTVIGNGTQTIRELILQNTQLKIRDNITDPLLEKTLSIQKKTLDDIPEKGVSVKLKLHSSLAYGGSMKDVTSLVHESIIGACSKAARSTGYILAGVDVICEDIQKPLNEQQIFFIEINGKPDIYIHHNPSTGSPRNVAKEILQYIFFENHGD